MEGLSDICDIDVCLDTSDTDHSHNARHNSNIVAADLLHYRCPWLHAVFFSMFYDSFLADVLCFYRAKVTKNRYENWFKTSLNQFWNQFKPVLILHHQHFGLTLSVGVALTHQDLIKKSLTQLLTSSKIVDVARTTGLNQWLSASLGL